MAADQFRERWPRWRRQQWWEQGTDALQSICMQYGCQRKVTEVVVGLDGRLVSHTSSLRPETRTGNFWLGEWSNRDVDSAVLSKTPPEIIYCETRKTSPYTLGALQIDVSKKGIGARLDRCRIEADGG